jgi:hypothetical protein
MAWSHAMLLITSISVHDVFTIPIIPLYNIDSLPSTLTTIELNIYPISSPPSSPVLTLLPYCSNRPPLPERAVHVLSDTFRNMADLAQSATTYDGQTGLRDVLSDHTILGRRGLSKLRKAWRDIWSRLVNLSTVRA